MRIVGGKLSGRKLEPPLSLSTRPMMDRVRQALFNIVEHHDWGNEVGDVLQDSHVLDAFCGTGALAYEALSRGAAMATLFDKDPQALTVAKKNAKSLGVEKSSIIMAADALRPPKASRPCQLAFLAPPYQKGLILPALLALDKAGWLDEHPLIIAETAKKEALELSPEFTTLFSRYYGIAALHFVLRQNCPKS